MISARSGNLPVRNRDVTHLIGDISAVNTHIGMDRNGVIYSLLYPADL